MSVYEAFSIYILLWLADLGSPVTRWASIAFGAGVGLGSAYSDCSRLFDASPAKVGPPKITETPAQV